MSRRRRSFGIEGSFESVEAAIEQGNVLADIPHPLVEKYPYQRILVVLVDDDAFNVPYVTTDDGIFLKTMYPSRKSTMLFLDGGDDDEP